MRLIPVIRAGAGLVALFAIAVAIATPPTASALSVIDKTSLEVATIPLDVIELDSCPPRCSAYAFARLRPSAIYKPLEPDEIIFEGETSLIWGDSAGSQWLVWGRGDGPTIVVWDDSMWVEEFNIEIRGARSVAKSPYSVSPELRIRDPRPRQSGGAAVRARNGKALANEQAAAVGNLDEVPAELLTPVERSWISKLLERLSKSQYAVGAVTIALMALMARLVR